MTAPTAPRSGAATGRGCPVDLPGPEGDNSIAREPLWYAYGAGDDQPAPPDWTWMPEPPPDDHVPPPPPRGRGARTTLPLGTLDLLARMPFPRVPGPTDSDSLSGGPRPAGAAAPAGPGAAEGASAAGDPWPAGAPVPGGPGPAGGLSAPGGPGAPERASAAGDRSASGPPASGGPGAAGGLSAPGGPRPAGTRATGREGPGPAGGAPVAGGARSANDTSPSGGSPLTDPAGRSVGDPPPADPLGRALVTAFGPQRREPENPYNDHRSYASPRCLFPVHAFVDGGGEDPWRLLEPDRHALTGAPGPGPGRRIALTGRYTAIPSAYKWFRGSLVAIELGIVLRALSIGLELFGQPARLRLPDPGAHAVLDGIGLDRTWEWSLPFVLDVGDQQPAAPAGTAPGPVPPDVARHDPALADLVRVNRSQTYSGDAVPLTTAVPAGLPASRRTPDWAELLWQRHSGRMPRALHGMTGRRRRVPAEALDTALRWLAVPPPGPELAAAFDAVRITVVTQGVDGHEDGVHRAEAATARLFRRDAEAPALLEDHYGYGVSPVNGCGIRNAPMTVFLSVRPRELFARLGPAGWGAAQHACGWAVHGLCLSAAASGLFARPVRAFKEIPVQRVLGLEEDETIVLSAVVGVPQDTGGPLLDLRL